MRAVVQERYGPPEALRVREAPEPAVPHDGVLVRVRAASVNALEWHVTRGMPYVVRLAEGLTRPRRSVRGVDVAGLVEAVGPRATRFRPGDEVFGGADGSFAELAACRELALARKPEGVAFEQAATLNVAGLTALQGLRDKARVRPGHRVLVHGAGGGVGTFAVQVAKWLGAHVTAVTRAEGVDAARRLGADAVIDRSREDFARRPERYDVMFDVGGTRSLSECRRVLTRNGAYLPVGGPPGRWLAPATRMLRATLASPFVPQRIVPFVSKADPDDLALLGRLAAEGRVVPRLDRVVPLDEVPAAVRLVGEGRAGGKVAVRVA